MKYGFVRVAAASPTVQVADCFYNISQIEKLIHESAKQQVQVAVFPELSITGYTCMDLFWQKTLLCNAEKALVQLLENTKKLSILCIVGMPLQVGNRIYNVAVAFQKGEVLGIVPKTYLANSGDSDEKRWFSSAKDLLEEKALINKKEYFISDNLLFVCDDLSIAIELGDDLLVPNPPSTNLCMQGANIVCNLSAANEIVGSHAQLRSLIKHHSLRCMAGYIYASSGFGESSTDLVYLGKGIVAESGDVLAESERFSLKEKLVITEIDIDSLDNARKQKTIFNEGVSVSQEDKVIKIPFDPVFPVTSLYRTINAHPFIPSEEKRDELCEEVLMIQQAGLAKRLLHTRTKTSVLGVSGGLDSTLALLVAVMTYDELGTNRKQILGVTMPGFGTTSRTYQNSLDLMEALGVTQREISIVEAVNLHFKDIGHDPSLQDATYENSQARERTQILMDLANMESGMVIGTGDLSELALGWATYNGDHMSMYAVNSSIPKTLMKHLVLWIADNKVDDRTAGILRDIVNTPISPELTPADSEGAIKQKTEELVGPYELHDFFLFHMLKEGASPQKIYFLAQQAFKEIYSKEIIKKWLYIFYHRFFSQQFKRSCMPDGPKTGLVSLSPRGAWKMPSDALATAWLKETEELD